MMVDDSFVTPMMVPELPEEFVSGNEVPVPQAVIKRGRMVEILEKYAEVPNRVIGRRVVCAANRCTEEGEMVIGVRHFDRLMCQKIDSLNIVYGYELDFSEQGFIDQYGVFMDRQEAWRVAVEAGQIIRRVGGDDSQGGTLYSENLY